MTSPLVLPHGASRRLFLRQAGALSLATGVAAPLALNLAAVGAAAAQTAGDYKALVCVFLYGGNDAFNTVLATDAASWQAYTQTRDQAPDSIALLAPGVQPDSGAALASPARLGGVLPLALAAAGDNPGRSFALHPELAPLAGLFNEQRRLAVLANVGPLLRPTTKAEHDTRGFPLPRSLYSHNDQQSTWQALAPEGATRGWGGRMGDLLAAQNERAVFTAVSAAGNAVWLSGQSVRQYQVGQSGAVRLGVDNRGRVFGSEAVGSALQRIAIQGGDHVLGQDLAAIAARSIEAEALLRDSLPAPETAPFGTAPASGGYNANNDPLLRFQSPLGGNTSANALARQLQVVARLIDAGRRGLTGVRRQVFFVSLGGFDTHDNQNRQHAELMARLGHGLAYFDRTLGLLGAHDSVTTFTASDFGRTFTSNGDGTDHGWGAHHVVMGGAVRGGQVFGRFPVLGVKNADNNRFDSSPDQLRNGSLLPTTSVEQMGATLGRWFGLSGSQVAEVFPNLGQFDAARRDLGFMRI
jgi:uncharacterized protein (DUF1501 family)